MSIRRNKEEGGRRGLLVSSLKVDSNGKIGHSNEIVLRENYSRYRSFLNQLSSERRTYIFFLQITFLTREIIVTKFRTQNHRDIICNNNWDYNYKLSSVLYFVLIKSSTGNRVKKILRKKIHCNRPFNVLLDFVPVKYKREINS